jgi:hypothetical protein
MTVLNDLDRFHLVMDVIDRLPQTGDQGIYLKQQLKDKRSGTGSTSTSMASTCPRSATGDGKNYSDRYLTTPCPENDDGHHWNWRPTHPDRRCLCDRDDLSKLCEGY